MKITKTEMLQLASKLDEKAQEEIKYFLDAPRWLIRQSGGRLRALARLCERSTELHVRAQRKSPRRKSKGIT